MSAQPNKVDIKPLPYPWQKGFWRWRRRLNQTRYVNYLIIAFVLSLFLFKFLAIIFVYIFHWLYQFSPYYISQFTAFNVIWLLAKVISIIPIFWLSAQRMHDIGFSGWFALFPPFWLLIALYPNRSKPNRFGEPEKEATKLESIIGFVLVLLVVVIAFFNIKQSDNININPEPLGFSYLIQDTQTNS